MIKKYPKPVLCNDFVENSLYKTGFEFKLVLEEEKQRITAEGVELFFTSYLKSEVLTSLIEANLVRAFYKVKTNHFSKMYPFSIKDDETICIIEKEKLDRIDKIVVTLYLVAQEKFDLPSNEELIDEAKPFVFSYKNNDLLAVSNSESLNYTISGKPFINISLAEQQENNGLSFSSLNKQVIQIKVGPSWNEAYTKLLQNKTVTDVMSPFLAFDAILYALEKAIHDENNISKDKDWYKIIDQNFDSDKYTDLDDFIYNMRIEYDVDSVFSIVQKILNNSLETKIVKASRRSR